MKQDEGYAFPFFLFQSFVVYWCVDGKNGVALYKILYNATPFLLSSIIITCHVYKRDGEGVIAVIGI